MSLVIYQVDAFTENLFSGNPAAIVPLKEWLPDDLLQKIAMENNLAETAFYRKTENKYEIRWFTPTVEVDLCGHATLAAAYILYYHEGHTDKVTEFYSHRSGRLMVTRNGEMFTLDFPADALQQVPVTAVLKNCFNIAPTEAYRGKTDYLLVFPDERAVQDLVPFFDHISMVDGRGIIVTAKGNACDFVSRFFAPQSGINEDPVTGSAHTSLTPYWYKQTGRKKMAAKQLSLRGGDLWCEYAGDRILISGKARLYLQGNIHLDEATAHE